MKLIRTESVKLEVIFTFKNKPQEIVETELRSKEFCFQTKEDFEQILLSMSQDDKNLQKASCCIKMDDHIDLPIWYIACHGKFFFDDVELEERNLQ